MSESQFIVRLATDSDIMFSNEICAEMESSAKARGTGIAKRSPDYIDRKIHEGKAIIALREDRQWAGFCYIETWEDGKYVANSGLIVAPEFRKHGLAKEIKSKIFELSRAKYPNAKIFGLTTGLAVMKINSELGYEPVTYSELTDDNQFWAGCQSCVNFEILTSKERKNCLCTAMLYDPSDKGKEKEKSVIATNGHETHKAVVPEVKELAQTGKKRSNWRGKWKKYIEQITKTGNHDN